MPCIKELEYHLTFWIWGQHLPINNQDSCSYIMSLISDTREMDLVWEIMCFLTERWWFSFQELLEFLLFGGLKMEKTVGTENEEKYVWMSEHEDVRVNSYVNKPWNLSYFFPYHYISSNYWQEIK